MLDGGQRVDDAHSKSIGLVWVGLAYCAILVVSAALIGLTYQISLQPETIPLEWQWNLRWEHNFAAWWSGSLLAVAAMLALDNAIESPRAKLRKAWIVLGMIVLFLALDEIGSLHERMGTISQSMHAGSWALAIPLGVVIAYLSIRAGFTMLLHGGRERVQIVILGLGFAILLSVAFQEYLEHTINWDGRGLKAARAMVEEGSELVGISIVLVAVGLPLLKTPTRAFQSIMTHQRRFLIGAAVLAVPFLAISADLDPSKGYPSDWLASVLFLGAGLAWLRSAWTGSRWFVPVLLAGLCGLASLGSVALGHDESFTIAGFEIARRGLVFLLVGCTFGVFAGWRTGLAVLAPAMALIMLASVSPLWVLALGSLCGMAAFWATVSANIDQNGISSSKSS
ncbi:hypothetical protein [Altererythrobacter sp. GH1-8]|uniref:hypothetical protein n=1 Tax=Altererythrobacter sp. GH1-8 TaxID=3349333 RepID=UPI00374CE893